MPSKEGPSAAPPTPLPLDADQALKLALKDVVGTTADDVQLWSLLPTLTALSATSVRVNWTDRSANETGFQVYRRTGATGTFAPVGAVLPANSVTFTDTTAAPATLASGSLLQVTVVVSMILG